MYYATQTRSLEKSQQNGGLVGPGYSGKNCKHIPITNHRTSTCTCSSEVTVPKASSVCSTSDKANCIAWKLSGKARIFAYLHVPVMNLLCLTG